MLYNRCTVIYKFGNNTYPRRIRRRSNLGHIFRGKKCVLWAGKYGILDVADHVKRSEDRTQTSKTLPSHTSRKIHWGWQFL